MDLHHLPRHQRRFSKTPFPTVMNNPLVLDSLAGDIALAALLLHVARTTIVTDGACLPSGQAFAYSARKPSDSGFMLLKFQSMVTIAD